MGIEPTSKAWEAFILPLNYTRGPDEILSCTVMPRKRILDPHDAISKKERHDS